MVLYLHKQKETKSFEKSKKITLDKVEGLWYNKCSKTTYQI